MSKIKGIVKQIDLLSDWTGKIVSWLVLALVGVVVYDVFLRYALNIANIWAYDMSYFLFGTHFVLGYAYTLRHQGHVRIDVFALRFSSRVRAGIDAMCYLILTVTFSAVVMWQGANLAINSWEILERSYTAWNPPIYLFKTALPIGAFLLLLQGLAEFVRNFIFAIKGEKV